MPHRPEDAISEGGHGEMPPVYEEHRQHQAVQQPQQQPYAVQAQQPALYIQPATAGPVQTYGQPTYIQHPRTTAQYGHQHPAYIQNQPQGVYVAQPVTQEPASIPMGNPIGVPTCQRCGAALHIREEPVRVSVW
eukprot:CAMPEP_0185256122 /NCGR_PEP_ID=MMETSP1359-20130426/5200_1 /TAXON_ID=552665 /ORGANISM="Bigelowiella longifila, Strain CCMP242" /LENGTH=133 /DNA_ID=CAMNT_0027840489 /DNA_START=149 /DNA_END=547 /DNA_ORIENTATION=+